MSEPTECPRCRKPLLPADETGRPRCVDCGPVVEETGLGQALAWGLSLPERAIRSIVGLGAGTVKEVAEFLVPRAFQDAKTYEVVVRNSLRFLIEDVGGVAARPGSEGTSPDYIARKTVGNFLDLAGLATLHVSPLWILAILSDVAHGTRSYVLELASELEREGIIDGASSIHGIDDILDAVGKASGQTANLFDAPPLSVEQLRETIREVRKAAASADFAGAVPAGEIQRLWEEMKEVATRENLSLFEVSSGLALAALERMKSAATGTLTGIRVASGLFDRHVIGHYTATLRDIRERGFFSALGTSFAPYVEAVWTNFVGGRGTVTEDVVTGRLLGRALGKIGGWFSRAAKKGEGPAPEDSRTDAKASEPESKSKPES